jgi:hypothetical protein
MLFFEHTDDKLQWAVLLAAGRPQIVVRCQIGFINPIDSIIYANYMILYTRHNDMCKTAMPPKQAAMSAIGCQHLPCIALGHAARPLRNGKKPHVRD